MSKEFLTRKKVLKAQITRSIDKINNYEVDIETGELLLEKCKEFKNEIKTIFDGLYLSVEEGDIDTFIDEQQLLLDKIEKTQIQINKKLKELNKPALNKTQSETVSPYNQNVECLKLPQLSLPSFSGVITEWITFRDLFNASVNSNKNISNAQKLQYLKASLKGDAYKIVQTIVISDDNYKIAWDLLEERFSNKREQIFANIKKFMTIPNIIAESPNSILNLVDTISEVIRSLEILEEKIDNFGDTLITYIILNKLDSTTKLWWERQLKSDEIPKINKLIDFLKNYARTLQNSKSSERKINKPPFSKVNSFTATISCSLCKEGHPLQKCSKFLNINTDRKIEFVRKNRLCYNCLSGFHGVKHCKSINTCRHCDKKHHTLLHISNHNFKTRSPPTHSNFPSVEAQSFFPPNNLVGNADECKIEEPVVLTSNCASLISQSSRKESDLSHSRVLLCTAKIKVLNSTKEFVECRCLLDTASEQSFIRRECANKLGLSTSNCNVSISCLGDKQAALTDKKVNLVFTSHFNTNCRFRTSAFVIEKVTGKLPSTSFPSNLKDHFEDLVLADPLFTKSQDIDILFGVNVFFTVITGEKIKRHANLPYAMGSKLGYIISGTTDFESTNAEISVNHVNINTDDLIKSFWELEQVPIAQHLSKEEKLCESLFNESQSRDANGRYSVNLPFKSDRADLGESRAIAFRKFINLEKRLLKNPDTYNQYKQFMSEYLSLGHMEKVNKNNLDIENAHYFIPHHHVLNETSLTTKLRVVFNASSKSSTNVSLNDILMNGPKVQEDLFNILLKFRCNNIAITCDLQKMYRQVNINDNHREFQKILWRDDPSKQIDTFKLNTVTYGTTPAAYLATRVLKQLTIDDGSNYPKASEILLHNCYIDDCLFGANTYEEAVELISQLCTLLKKGCFELHKWCSNNKSILKNISQTQNIDSASAIVNSKTIKVLGVEWEPTNDTFNCKINMSHCNKSPTKRTILSAISAIYDPMGWLQPFVIANKILIQQLWKHQIGWDDPVPQEIRDKWQSYLENCKELKSIRIPRQVSFPDATKIELHCFCDSSEQAYCSAIYLKCCNNGYTRVNLLASKTRVAPMKTISIPRLELCSAVLLVHLLRVVRESLQLPIDLTCAWTDSTIVLAWLNADPSRWQTFVANRVAEVQSILPREHWHHVQSQDNPADCATRGMSPSELANCELWFKGPQWLQNDSDAFPLQSIHQSQDENIAIKKEEKRNIVSLITPISDDHIIFKFSSWSKLLRVLAFCHRFVINASQPSTNRIKGVLKCEELQWATTAVIKIVQTYQFPDELSALKSGKLLKPSSKLITLNPFLDHDGVMRVGGRLRNANISIDQKHPVLLPKTHHITTLIIRYYHLSHLHAGPQLLLAVIRQKYWVLSGRDAVRRFIRSCSTCSRSSATSAQQIMADLPSIRVTPTRTFSKTGVDYAGPFMCKTKSGRGAKTFKVYICLFICLATRALHIELVSDLSTPAFLAALKRFVSRRGKPSVILSDCATNFKGANNELRELYKTVPDFERKLAEYAANQQIQWQFNPPSAPHFGGMWEAGVKSVKFHLKRTMGNSIFTVEELSTLLAQVEACLNSRPLCPLSTDPNDLEVLTPGHFLIGAPMTAVPELNVTETPINRLSRWQLAQRALQHFWKRWSTEYLSRLQQRPKWCLPKDNIKVGDLVLIKNELLPPLQWKRARVKTLYPGKDGKVRVVTVVTAQGDKKRPIHKLCLLPME